VPFTSLDDRRALKQKLGLDNVRTAVFTGSWHGPNLEAVTHLISMSETLPEMNFLVLGSSGNAFENQSLPANMAMAGVVTEQEKNLILSMADVALNPMTSGSGTNLKMLEYFAAGVPVISTPFGARGLACRPGSELHTADIASFPQAVTAFFTQPDKSVQQMVLQARWLAENTYDWAVIARNMQDRLRDQI
jgi:glycosyltransferase involved in cell wall biosynthesis